jgi:hypothetical protein
VHDPHDDPTAAEPSADRREFIRGLAALIAATGAGLSQGAAPKRGSRRLHRRRAWHRLSGTFLVPLTIQKQSTRWC